MSKVVIIGAGPAGCMAALIARENGHNVIVIEKNGIIGKKLNITGKGRCNITYKGDNQYFLDNVVNNSKFMMSSINNFNNDDLLTYLSKLNVATKLERGNRIFLKSDNAAELSERLYKELVKSNIKIMFNTTVKEIIVKEGAIAGVKLSDDKVLGCDSCVISTGGKSYPATGSTGDGYLLAKGVGHDIVDIKPALVPIKCYEIDSCKNMQGLTLKNVGIKIIDVDDAKKIIYNDFGEMMFTHFGITGPIILSASSKINSIKNIHEKLNQKKIKCIIDLKPALILDKLYNRINRDFEKYSNKELKNSLNDLLPKSIIGEVIKKSGIPGEKKINQITKVERENLAKRIKEFELTLKALMPVDIGIVTAGGINTKQINPKTMESKLVKNLFFAGEVIDVDAYTGGFNLQIAFTTGYVAGNSII